MDLQKVASQTASAANPRSEGSNEGKGIFAIPFADLVRSPVFMVGDLLSNKNETTASRDAASEHPVSVDKADNQQSDRNDDRQVDVRDNSRDDKPRVDNQGDENTGRSSDDDSRRASSNNQDDPNNKTGNDDADDNDVVQQAASDDNDNNEASSGDSDDVSETTSDTGSDQDGANVTTASTETDTEAGAGFETALDDLLAAAHATGTVQNDGAVKEAASVLSSAAAGPKVVTVNDTAKVSTVVDPSQQGAGENLNTNNDQAKQAQQAQQALARVGSQTAGNANEVAKNAVEQPLVEQQAKALADTLKSDKPVKIQVNVDPRASATVSQTAQSLNTNAVAAQESANAQAARTNASQATASEGPQQVPLARVDGTTVMPGQTQALNQLAQNNANSAAESGINRATAQVSSASAQSSHGGGEATNSTTPGGSGNLQTANAQKAEQAQAARSPQQARPIAQQISVNITKAISEGLDRISIQLRPDNLGRVEVKLEVAQNGRVNANIIVDRPETLEMLRNDSRNLERALQDAGLDTQSGDLSFNLRDHQENPDDSQSDNRMAKDGDNAEEGDLEAEMATKLLNGEIGEIISDMRVDIRA